MVLKVPTVPSAQGTACGSLVGSFQGGGFVDGMPFLELTLGIVLMGLWRWLDGGLPTTTVGVALQVGRDH